MRPPTLCLPTQGPKPSLHFLRSQATVSLKQCVAIFEASSDPCVVNNGATPAQRAAVFDALPRGQKAGLVLKDADHFTFAGQELPALLGRRQRPEAVMRRQTEHLKQLALLTTDWWLSQLENNPAATQRLAAPKIREVRGDVWLQG